MYPKNNLQGMIFLYWISVPVWIFRTISSASFSGIIPVISIVIRSFLVGVTFSSSPGLDSGPTANVMIRMPSLSRSLAVSFNSIGELLKLIENYCSKMKGYFKSIWMKSIGELLGTWRPQWNCFEIIDWVKFLAWALNIRHKLLKPKHTRNDD